MPSATAGGQHTWWVCRPQPSPTHNCHELVSHNGTVLGPWDPRGTAQRIRTLLKPIPLTDEDGEPLAAPPALVRAKTGTLNFVSCLAGYARTLPGRDLAFAIMIADPERRAEAAAASDDEVPPGGRDWTARARRLQQVLLQHWAATAA